MLMHKASRNSPSWPCSRRPAEQFGLHKGKQKESLDFCKVHKVFATIVENCSCQHTVVKRSADMKASMSRSQKRQCMHVWEPFPSRESLLSERACKIRRHKLSRNTGTRIQKNQSPVHVLGSLPVAEALFSHGHKEIHC